MALYEEAGNRGAGGGRADPVTKPTGWEGPLNPLAYTIFALLSDTGAAGLDAAIGSAPVKKTTAGKAG